MASTRRFTDKEKREDPWYKRLSRDDRDLWEYLLDICDHAGFFEIETEFGPEDIVEALKIETIEDGGDAKWLERGLQVLSKASKRGPRLLTKGSLSDPDKIYGWIPGYINYQHVSKSKVLSQKIPFHKHIADMLEEKKKMFPKVSIYLSKYLLTPLRGLKVPLVRPNDNDNSNDKIDRESEGKKDFSVKETNPIYVEWVNKYPDMRAVLSYERFIELVHRWPEKDVDYYQALEWLYECELKSMDDEPVNGYLMLCKAFSNTGKGKGFRKPGVEAQVDPSKAEYEKERARLNDLWNRGKIEDDECRKLQAANQAKYDGGGE